MSGTVSICSQSFTSALCYCDLHLAALQLDLCCSEDTVVRKPLESGYIFSALTSLLLLDGQYPHGAYILGLGLCHIHGGFRMLICLHGHLKSVQILINRALKCWPCSFPRDYITSIELADFSKYQVCFPHMCFLLFFIVF